MPTLRRIETAVLATVLGIAALCGILFVTGFVCGRIVYWPYYAPEVAGAEVTDPAAGMLLPRGNLSPIAVYPLGGDTRLRIRAACYPGERGGVQPCLVQFGLAGEGAAHAAFTGGPVSVRAPDGSELADVAHYAAFADRYAPYPMPRVVEGRLRLDPAAVEASIALRAIPLPQTFTLLVPDISVDGATVSVPPIRFVRKGGTSCIGLVSNY